MQSVSPARHRSISFAKNNNEINRMRKMRILSKLAYEFNKNIKCYYYYIKKVFDELSIWDLNAKNINNS